jgi:ABC transport system ATP-binding/permease protein
VICVDLAGVTVRRPDRTLIGDLSLTVASGDRIGVVGLNGSGKSTLLRLVTGALQPDDGTVRFGRGVRISVLDQEAAPPPGTVLDAVGGGWEAEAVLDRLGMGGLFDRDVGTLSGGQAKRVALARSLVTECDLLVLDEPTNHLDVDAIEWLTARLARFAGALMLVTHDRHVLDDLTTRVVEIDRGAIYVHTGGYRSYLDGRALREEQAASAEQKRRNLARTELAWLRRGAPARTSKPKARIDAATALVNARPQAAARSGDLGDALGSLGATRLGSKVVELHDVGHRFGSSDGPWLFRHLDLVIEPGDRLGIVGPNGAGKSTLLDIMRGALVPAEGRVEVGTTVRFGMHDQLGASLHSALRVREVVAGPARQPDFEDARLMDRFWFTGETQYALVSELSGGERRRLQLLATLAAKPNVLILDEPTNDLDLDTLRVLEDFCDDWAGALVVVSHDRAFLERTVEQVVAISGDGTARLVRGGYAAWLEQRRAVLPTARPTTTAPAPKPVPRRTTSTLNRLMAQAEKTLDAAVTARDALATELQSATDHVRITALSTELAVASAAVDAAEERWLELAAEAESAR